MEDGHAKTVDEVLNYFSTDPERGLSTDQVKRYQEKYGPNGELRTFALRDWGARNDGDRILMIQKIYDMLTICQSTVLWRSVDKYFFHSIHNG